MKVNRHCGREGWGGGGYHGDASSKFYHNEIDVIYAVKTLERVQKLLSKGICISPCSLRNPLIHFFFDFVLFYQFFPKSGQIFFFYKKKRFLTKFALQVSFLLLNKVIFIR